MSIYEIILYCSLLFSVFNSTKNSNILVLCLICVMLCTAAFRDINIGTDTLNYYIGFLHTTNLQILSDKANSEYLYTFITYVFRKYLNYDWYMLFWYSCIMISAAYVIIKSSVNKSLSIFLFVSCGFFTISLNVMRQYVAVLIMFLAIYEYSKDKYNIYKISIISIVCFFIHNSSIILWPLFFFKKIELSKSLQFIVVCASFILGFFLTNYLQSFFVLMSAYVGRFEGYLLYEGDGTRNFISNLGVNVMFVATLFYASRKTIQSVYFKAYFISMILFNIVGSMYYLTRITEFYAIAQIICIPTVLHSAKNKKFYSAFVILLVIYCLSRFYAKGLYSFLPYSIRDNINLLF